MPGIRLHHQINPIEINGEFEDVISWIHENCGDDSTLILFTYYERVLMSKCDEYLNKVDKVTEDILPSEFKYDDLFKIALLAVLEGCNYHTEMENLERRLDMRHWTLELSDRVHPRSHYGPQIHLQDLEDYRRSSKLLKIPCIYSKIDEFIRSF